MHRSIERTHRAEYLLTTGGAETMKGASPTCPWFWVLLPDGSATCDITHLGNKQKKKKQKKPVEDEKEKVIKNYPSTDFDLVLFDKVQDGEVQATGVAEKNTAELQQTGTAILYADVGRLTEQRAAFLDYCTSSAKKSKPSSSSSSSSSSDRHDLLATLMQLISTRKDVKKFVFRHAGRWTRDRDEEDGVDLVAGYGVKLMIKNTEYKTDASGTGPESKPVRFHKELGVDFVDYLNKIAGKEVKQQDVVELLDGPPNATTGGDPANDATEQQDLLPNSTISEQSSRRVLRLLQRMTQNYPEEDENVALAINKTRIDLGLSERRPKKEKKMEEASKQKKEDAEKKDKQEDTDAVAEKIADAVEKDEKAKSEDEAENDDYDTNVKTTTEPEEEEPQTPSPSESATFTLRNMMGLRYMKNSMFSLNGRILGTDTANLHDALGVYLLLHQLMPQFCARERLRRLQTVKNAGQVSALLAGLPDDVGMTDSNKELQNPETNPKEGTGLGHISTIQDFDFWRLLSQEAVVSDGARPVPSIYTVSADPKAAAWSSDWEALQERQQDMMSQLGMMGMMMGMPPQVPKIRRPLVEVVYLFDPLIEEHSKQAIGLLRLQPSPVDIYFLLLPSSTAGMIETTAQQTSQSTTSSSSSTAVAPFATEEDAFFKRIVPEIEGIDSTKDVKNRKSSELAEYKCFLKKVRTAVAKMFFHILTPSSSSTSGEDSSSTDEEKKSTKDALDDEDEDSPGELAKEQAEEKDKKHIQEAQKRRKKAALFLRDATSHAEWKNLVYAYTFDPATEATADAEFEEEAQQERQIKLQHLMMMGAPEYAVEEEMLQFDTQVDVIRQASKKRREDSRVTVTRYLDCAEDGDTLIKEVLEPQFEKRLAELGLEDEPKSPKPVEQSYTTTHIPQNTAALPVPSTTDALRRGSMSFKTLSIENS
eukprot:GSA25T00008018001.1